MKGKAIPFLVLAGLCLATSAMAVDLHKRPAGSLGGAMGVTPEMATQPTLNVILGCDNGNAFNAYYQKNNARYGNVFNFPPGSKISAYEFVHYGFGYPGPYNYDFELWDWNTCTYIGGVNNLQAADAAAALQVEYENVCNSNLIVSGDVAVTVDANSCIPNANPEDCYPDLIYDDQLYVACPVIVDLDFNVCYGVEDQSGPFIFRVEYNNCPVPVTPASWGKVKVLYR